MARLPLILYSIAAFGFATAAAENCKVINNLHYCEEVQAITYNNIGFSGTYQDVVGYDPDACTCSLAPKSFSGTLAPLDEQLSLHLRGPMNVKQIAVYTPGAPKKVKRHSHAHHAHHRRQLDIQTRTITRYVTVVHGENPEPTPNPGDIHQKEKETPAPKKEVKVPEKVEDVEEIASGEWVRQSYYNAESQTRDNLVFMNHKGGDKSGVFDYCIGNSISFADEEGTAGAAEPTTLKDKTLLSNEELVVFSGEKCDESCGYVRPGVPAYKGFGGTKKIFLLEFGMPADESGAAFNRNIPAVWMLNAKIPRSAQYGKKAGGDGNTSCSCWDSGCGELDVFEVIDGAFDYVKTHYHSKQGAIGGYGGGGSKDYFPRPYQGTVKAAIVFDGSKSVTITFLPKNTEFPASFGESFVNKCTGKAANGPSAASFGTSLKKSVFNVPA